MQEKINKITNIDDIWEDETYIKIKHQGKKQIAIEANKKGLLSLAKMFMSMAENGIVDDHFWIYSYCGYIDKDSDDIVISKID